MKTASPVEGSEPVFLRIARALQEDMRRGVLKPGQQIPGSRALAEQFEVHRNTALAAVEELKAQGWLRSEPSRGTFVSEALPDEDPGRNRRGTLVRPPRYALPELPPLHTLRRDHDEPGGRALHLSAGVPDPRLFPVEELSRSFRRTLRRGGASLLSYGHPAGHPALRAALAELLVSRRGVRATERSVLVTRGSQMALDLCARGLLRPGDAVAVEALGYRPAWDALRLAGAELVPLPVDGGGLRVEALEQALERRAIRALYTTPHHQYPTTVTLAPGRRIELLDLARRHRLLVLEDDYDHEFHYEGRPVLPLASEDDGGTVVYIGTLSKILAPGLRLGFLAASPRVIERLQGLRAVMDRQGDQPVEAAVAGWIQDGDLLRHARKMRASYRERRDALVQALERWLPADLSFERPRGGISLWARVTPGVDLRRWTEACEERGVRVNSGEHYTFDGHEPGALRLVFSALTPAELRRAVRIMAESRPRGGA